MEDSRRGFETCLELLQAGDADGLRRILQQDPAHSEARDSTGVSLLMHSLYRGRRDLAELIASKKKALDIFEAAALGRLDRLKQCLRDDPFRYQLPFKRWLHRPALRLFFRPARRRPPADRKRSGSRRRGRESDAGHAAALRRLIPQPGSRPPSARTRSPRKRPSASRMGSDSRRRPERRSPHGGTTAQAPRRSETSQRSRARPQPW